MSFLKRLFGGGGESGGREAPAGDPIEYKGFSIRATPFKDGASSNAVASSRKTWAAR
jgi:hypothetical protein